MFELSPNIDKNKIFLVNLSEIEGRLDPYYYSHPFINIKKLLIKNNYIKFRKIIKSLTNGYDYRNYSKSGTPYIKVANIKKGFFDFSKLQFVNFNSSEISKKIQLKKGNILLTRKGSFGIALALDKDYNYVISSEIFYIEIDNNIINPKFLEIFFNSNIGQQQFDQNKIGAIMGSLSQEVINNLIIPLPPKETQQKIINLYKTAYKEKQQKEAEAERLLNSIDNYLLGELGITLPEKDNSLENRIFKVNFSEVTGGRFDAEYYSNYNRKLITSIVNSRYPLSSIGEKCEFVAGYAFSSNDYVSHSNCILITIKNISKNTITFENTTYLPNEFYDKYKRFRVAKNNLLIAMTGATIGKVGIYESDKKALLNQRNGIIKSDLLNTYFLMNLLNTKLYQNLIMRNSVGGAQPNISETAILKIKIPLPPLEKQNEIAEHIKAVRDQAKQLKSEAKEVLEQAKQEVEQMILGE